MLLCGYHSYCIRLGLYNDAIFKLLILVNTWSNYSLSELAPQNYSTVCVPPSYYCTCTTFLLFYFNTLSLKLVVGDWLLSAITFSSILTFLENIWMKIAENIHRIICPRLTAFLGTLWVLSAPRNSVDSILSWLLRVNIYWSL